MYLLATRHFFTDRRIQTHGQTNIIMPKADHIILHASHR